MTLGIYRVVVNKHTEIKSKLNQNETKIKPSCFMMGTSSKEGRCFYAHIQAGNSIFDP